MIPMTKCRPNHGMLVEAEPFKMKAPYKQLRPAKTANYSLSILKGESENAI